MSIYRRPAALLLALLAFALTAQAADNYKVDPVHSTSVFRIQHMNVAYFYGRFNGPEGTVSVDEADPTKTSFDVQLKVANIDTANPNRDKHLKSPDFFSAEEFPTISFKSTAVKVAEDKKMEVTGDLTLHGKTKSITVPVERTGSADTRMGHRTGFEATIKIKRSEFGMDKMLDALGDEVTIRVGLEAQKQ